MHIEISTQSARCNQKSNCVHRSMEHCLPDVLYLHYLMFQPYDARGITTSMDVQTAN